MSQSYLLYLETSDCAGLASTHCCKSAVKDQLLQTTLSTGLASTHIFTKNCLIKREQRKVFENILKRKRCRPWLKSLRAIAFTILGWGRFDDYLVSLYYILKQIHYMLRREKRCTSTRLLTNENKQQN